MVALPEDPPAPVVATEDAIRLLATENKKVRTRLAYVETPSYLLVGVVIYAIAVFGFGIRAVGYLGMALMAVLWAIRFGIIRGDLRARP